MKYLYFICCLYFALPISQAAAPSSPKIESYGNYALPIEPAAKKQARPAKRNKANARKAYPKTSNAGLWFFVVTLGASGWACYLFWQLLLAGVGGLMPILAMTMAFFAAFMGLLLLLRARNIDGLLAFLLEILFTLPIGLAFLFGGIAIQSLALQIIGYVFLAIFIVVFRVLAG